MADSAKQDIQVSVGEGFVIMGDDKVEVSADGKTVTAYTSGGVEAKAAEPVSAQGISKGVSISADFNTVVLNGVTIERAADGHLVIFAPGGAVSAKPAPANDSLARKALEVGERLRDGTVCIAVDLAKNEALFAPAGIFGGNAKFDEQHKIPARLNSENAHGHNDWRNITDEEGATLSAVWDKVAPPEQQGRAAPWFWLASPNYNFFGRVRRGGEADWNLYNRNGSLPVPCVCSGPARS
jgi:hypothetical protein